ncbi:excinuclease ABC subunit UvrA [Candidatus Methylopumilus universalis]|uniref:UvrABC system protein A n=1 Tax=Candidatus Methylopumilus universalis TaxID=2588536 RepID=A0AAX1F0G5_9PROT|nr:excinuclease ABC subunit UvrA [Candidatus Methylopumilus universalis]QDC41578.1 excinuclease ABC subunit UvrA [Candidatus Methylopumilus universalis]QDC42859.1 excinuclease ABC subunit UvrA [Candidatus Methylopumilus universalis]QDC55248.1 excinuclease ABC subunit UvrA [Candidatus Methylopumilus universalis]QDC56527.1 excinuclease ABC subunit UvrA [Candidatus Methylopumilus universalis]QDC57818.1 excinuclease ABC subunit UvrA [Candidatus Methylopumilus universalis]
MDTIKIRGARTHNLKNISLDLPRNKLIVITGLSGSGKSSLAFDTLYAEGQRRYVESLSAYARQFLERMNKPDVDLIEGLSPAISIEQKSTSHNPRSTVGTVTEIHDYLRLLYARAGEPECPTHAHTLESQTVSEMVDTLLALPNDTKIMLLAPIVNSRKGEQQDLFEDLKAQGFIRLRIDGEIYEIDALPKLTKTKKHQVDVVVDRIKINPEIKQRMTESTETALRLADGKMIAIEMDTNKSHLFSAKFACPLCDYSLEELEPRIFSFNNPMGACPECDGLGNINFFDPKRVVAFPHLSLASGAIKGWDKRNQFYFQLLQSLSEHYKFDLETVFEELSEKIQDVILNGSGSEQISFSYLNERGQINKKMHSFEGILNNLKRRYHETDSGTVRDELAKYLNMQTCPACEGSRLRIEARHVKVGKKNIHEICHTPLKETVHFFESLKLKGAKKTIAEKIIYEITSRLKFLVNVGLDYLSLSRSAETLSGGEAQRIRLASQIGSGLTGVMYVLDEPSIGLHQRDNDRLLETLKRLRDLGNTVIVVEHDQDAIMTADHVVDIGPGAGEHGGYIVAEGTPKMIAKHPKSLTGQYISGRKEIKYKNKRVLPRTLKWLELKGAKGNNLKNVHLKLPIGLLTCVTGVSGSGKSSLINDTLYRAVAHHLYGSHTEPAEHASIKGLDFFDKVVDVDQSPIGRTPRSNPATYTGLFTPTRELFAQLNESRNRGYGPGRFSFNVKGGRCEACEGDGVIKVEMHFLPDVYVPCDICQGKRYNRETLEIQFKGKNIHDVLSMTVEQAHQFFNAIPAVEKKLRTLIEVGLGYITLGQNATTLSGGEAQRVKLALELSKRDTGRTLYILDEPTTGLHFADIQLLLDVIHKLRDAGNTIVIIEHNLDVIKTADWVIDLGPEGGDGGGEIIAEGTPEEVANNKKSYTGKYLKPYLK